MAAKAFDLIVIGGGSGGSATAKRAAAYGAKVVLIERGATRNAAGVRVGAGVGGTCVNVGCVPKKLMFQCSQFREGMLGHISLAGGYGFKNVPESAGAFDWEGFKKSRDAYVARLNRVYKGGWEKAGVEVIMGLASFVDQKTVKVDKVGGGTELLTSKHILIACGGEPSVPKIPGAELAVTSDGFFDLEHQPKKAAVIGAGYIAVEMAGIFNGLGSDTHLFFRGETVLRRGFDPFIVDTLMKSLEAHGPTLHKLSTPAALEKQEDGTITLVLEDGSRHEGFDCVLMAIGRRPVTNLLNLTAAGLTTARGYIEVDDYENTKVGGIYALGDVTTTGYQLTPVAIAAGRRLADRLFMGAQKSRIEYENIATVVFSHPPIGTIGLTEPQAVKEFGVENVSVKQARFGSMMYAFNDEASKVKTGLKLVLAGPQETVVGVHCIGPASDEMLQGFSVAVKMGASRRDFESAVAIHPTIAEEMVTMAGWGQKKDEAGVARPWLAPYCEPAEAGGFVTKKFLLGAAVGVLLGGLTSFFVRSNV